MNRVMAFGGTSFQQELAENVANFCISELMPRIKTFDICIMLSDDMENADGYCLSRSNREFELEIDSRLKGEDFISAICHEMVHVKQHARGELIDKDSLTKIWKKAEYYAMYSTVDEYMALPWEAEAYTLQEELCSSFKEL